MDETIANVVKRKDYVAYLLRLWREGKDSPTWRASLHNPHTGEQLGFGSVEELFAFLQGQLGLQATAHSGPQVERRGGEAIQPVFTGNT